MVIPDTVAPMRLARTSESPSALSAVRSSPSSLAAANWMPSSSMPVTVARLRSTAWALQANHRLPVRFAPPKEAL